MASAVLKTYHPKRMTSQLASRLATSAPRSKRTTRAASCATGMAAACAASTRSGRLQAGDVTRRQPEHAADDPVRPAGQPAAGRPRRDQRPDDARGGGHQQLAGTAAISRPVAGTTVALLGHGGPHRRQAVLRSAGARADGPDRMCPLYWSLHEAVPGG